jgi:hypothetical protein
MESLVGLTIQNAEVVPHSEHCDSVNVLRLTMTNGAVYEITGGYGGYTSRSCDEYVEVISVEKVQASSLH